MIRNKTLFTEKALIILVLAALILATPNCSSLFLSSEKKEIKERLSQAELYSEQEAYVQAIQTYESILKYHPLNPWGDEVLFNLGCLYLFYTNPEKDFEKSKIYLERIIKEYPDSSYLKATMAMLAVLNTLVLKEKELAGTEQEITLKNEKIDSLRERIKSLQMNDFIRFISTAYELFLREKEIGELKKKIENQKKAIDLLQTQINKIKEVDIQHEKKKSDEEA